MVRFRMKPLLAATMLIASATVAGAADGVLRVGVSISTTGQGAALGIPQKNTLELVPKEIAGLKIETVVLDDAGDPTTATTNARRLATEDKVDIIIGSSVTPTSMAIANVASEAKVPQFALGPIPWKADKDTWSFVLPQPVPLMARGLYDDMLKRNAKKIGMIGFSDSWGDLWQTEFKKNGEPLGLSLVADERYARADTSVTGQVLKLIAQKPDAVLVAASGTAAALPVIALRERGFKGPIYQTHGAVTRDFIRIAGKAAEGVIFVSGPVVGAAEQADTSPTKAPGVAYTKAYEAKHGEGSITQFGAHIYDAFVLLEQTVPEALKKAKPGTPEFRAALRDAIESGRDLNASQAVYNFKPNDHYGVDARARMMLTVKNGNWANPD